VKLIDLITAQSARLKTAGVSFGHGTTNAFDEAAWLVLWALGMEPGELEAKAQRELSEDERARAEALVTQRIQTRRPAAYLTHEAWCKRRSTSTSATAAPSSPNCSPTPRTKARSTPG
jgi:ribosomal protein L3 glutamine methyltransferase